MEFPHHVLQPNLCKTAIIFLLACMNPAEEAMQALGVVPNREPGCEVLQFPGEDTG